MSQPPEQERLLFLLHIKQRIMSRIYKEQQSLKIKLKLNYPVKNGQLLNRRFSKEGIKMTHKYLKSILSHQGDSNLNCFKIPSHPSQNAYHQEACVGEAVEKTFTTAGGNAD